MSPSPRPYLIMRPRRVLAAVVDPADPWFGLEVEVTGRTRAGGMLVRLSFWTEGERHLRPEAVREI